MTDRATAVARAIMQMVVATPYGGVTELEQAVANYLRDEFADVVRTALTEIRPEDE